MKTFREYLTESQKSYRHRIKIAGETPDEFFDDFERDLRKYGITGFSEPKRSPVMKTLPGFSDKVENQEMYMVDIALDYPANEEQIRQIAVMLGKQPDQIVVSTVDHDDENAKAESVKAANCEDGALLNQDYDAASAEQKAMSDEYAKGQTTAAVNSTKTQFKFAGKLPEKAQTTNDLQQGVASPMSKINRPPKPEVGAKRKSQ